MKRSNVQPEQQANFLSKCTVHMLHIFFNFPCLHRSQLAMKSKLAIIICTGRMACKNEMETEIEHGGNKKNFAWLRNKANLWFSQTRRLVQDFHNIRGAYESETWAQIASRFEITGDASHQFAWKTAPVHCASFCICIYSKKIVYSELSSQSCFSPSATCFIIQLKSLTYLHAIKKQGRLYSQLQYKIAL